MDAALAYLHFASIMLLTAFLVSELCLCTPRLRLEQVPTLARLDLLYLIAAIAALTSGALRVFVSGKGAAFYLGNPVFYIKLALFLAIGLVSISPTAQFLRWRRALDAGEQPVLQASEIRTARRYIWLELALLAFVPLAAVLMARGIGMQR
jgi:putative membrane protein